MFDTVIDFLDKITIIFAFITMFGVLYGLYTRKKELDKIPIIFKNGENRYALDVDIVRKNLTRAEVLGILGVIQRDSTMKYNIAYLSKRRFFEDIALVQERKLDELIIELNDEELQYFDTTTLRLLEE